MDYKRLIIEMLENASNKQLKIIYYLVKGLID